MRWFSRDATKRPTGIGGSDYLRRLGFVVVDWVNDETLQAIAEQLGLRLLYAVETKEAKTSTRGGTFGLAAPTVGLTAELAGSASSTAERRFERASPAMRVRAVIETLVTNNELADYLDGEFGGPFDDRALHRPIYEITVFASLVERPDEEAKALSRFEEALIKRSKPAAEHRDWFLLEALWMVTSADPLTLSFSVPEPHASRKPRVFLAIEKQSLERTEEALRAPRDVREPDEPVRQRLAGFAARQLLLADRFPVVIDHLCRFAGDLLDRKLEVLGPEAKTGLSS